jgi:bifunctional non-homologous end joining protein LigD
MHYVVFDLLHLDDWDLCPAPFRSRKWLLRQLVSGLSDPVRYGEHIEGDGDDVLANACDLGLEGIIAKRPDAPYTEGRTRTWLKLKCSREQDLVIVGFTDPKGARAGFGALLLATRDGAKAPLRYVGRVGTGFNRDALQSLGKVLRAREQPEPAVPGLTRNIAGAGVHWVAPELVAQVSFAGWTNDRQIRHAVFHSLREDRDAGKVTTDGYVEEAAAIPKPGRVRLSNPDKLLFSDPPITKRELAEYWTQVAETALPFVGERPLTLLRCPDGIEECFYQKHIGSTAPSAIARVSVDEGEQPYAMVQGDKAFAALVQWGVIELHTWGARAGHLDQPDTLIFDLDPAEDLPWSAVVDAAEELKERIEALGLVPFAKLSGGKGLHLVIPVIPGPDWEAVKVFTRALAREMTRAEPGRFTVSMAKAKRTGKIFIDYLRNERESTAVAPYSPRARAGAPIAVPISWSDVLSERRTQPVVSLEDFGPTLRSHKRAHPWRAFEVSRRSLTD